MKELRVALTGGGTSGHRMPLVAVYQALSARRRPLRSLYLGEEDDCRSAEIKGLKIATAVVKAGKLRRYLSGRNFSDLSRVVIGFWQAKAALRDFGPQVLFSKGGYVSVPVVAAARLLKIPIVTHESDIVMGLANRINARFANVICTAYAKEYYRSLPSEKIHYTGNLIRQELLAARSARVGRFSIGGRPVPTGRPLILVLGGSQGAHRINELIVALLPSLLNNWVVVHQSGEGDIEWLRQKREQLPPARAEAYFPIPFLPVDELGRALRAADIVVSRAGSVISELALFAKPTILIPLASSAAGHQLRNARQFENQGAAVVLTEDRLKPSELLTALKRLTDAKVAARLIKGMRQLQDDQGSQRVAKIIEENAQK